MQIRYPITDHATVKDSPTERWAMDLNRYFSREDMKMTNKHMKRCPTSLALCAVLSCSVVSSSLRPHGLQPCRLLCPWDSPGKNTGVGCHALLQKIFPTQGSNSGLLHLPSEPPGDSAGPNSETHQDKELLSMSVPFSSFSNRNAYNYYHMPITPLHFGSRSPVVFFTDSQM